VLRAARARRHRRRLSARAARLRPRPEHSKLIVLGIDGLDPVTTDLLMSEGKLPNFARLRQEGAYGRLKSMEPMLEPDHLDHDRDGKAPLGAQDRDTSSP
jgi:hypothetical protein